MASRGQPNETQEQLVADTLSHTHTHTQKTRAAGGFLQTHTHTHTQPGPRAADAVALVKCDAVRSP